MSTFLQLCQDTARECGITGGGPSAVTGQSGELERIVGWVADAYTEIQGDLDWRWLRKKFTLVTTSGDDTYAFGDAIDVDSGSVIDRFKDWLIDDRYNPPKIHLQTTGVGGQVILTYTTWDHFEYLYRLGTIQNQTGFPNHISIDPADNIRLGLAPNDIYVVTGTYRMGPQTLAADDDVPEMPPAYHRLIMYNAMMFYSDYESAPEVERRAKRGILRIGSQLKRNQGPAIRVGGPLA